MPNNKFGETQIILVYSVCTDCIVARVLIKRVDLKHLDATTLDHYV